VAPARLTRKESPTSKTRRVNDWASDHGLVPVFESDSSTSTDRPRTQLGRSKPWTSKRASTYVPSATVVKSSRWGPATVCHVDRHWPLGPRSIRFESGLDERTPYMLTRLVIDGGLWFPESLVRRRRE
jgi:hypothetical protein